MRTAFELDPPTEAEIKAAQAADDFDPFAGNPRRREQKITAVTIDAATVPHVKADDPEVEDFIDDNRTEFPGTGAAEITMRVSRPQERRVLFEFLADDEKFGEVKVPTSAFAKAAKEYGEILQAIEGGDAGREAERQEAHMALAIDLEQRFRGVMDISDFAYKTQRWLANIFLAAAFPKAIRSVNAINKIYQDRIEARCRG